MYSGLVVAISWQNKCIKYCVWQFTSAMRTHTHNENLETVLIPKYRNILCNKSTFHFPIRHVIFLSLFSFWRVQMHIWNGLSWTWKLSPRSRCSKTLIPEKNAPSLYIHPFRYPFKNVLFLHIYESLIPEFHNNVRSATLYHLLKCAVMWLPLGKAKAIAADQMTSLAM